MITPKPDRRILLDVGDGPDGICIYESVEESMVDFASESPALYLFTSINGAYVKLGPYLPNVHRQILAKLNIVDDKLLSDREYIAKLEDAARQISGRDCGCINDMPGDNYTCTAHEFLRKVASGTGRRR